MMRQEQHFSQQPQVVYFAILLLCLQSATIFTKNESINEIAAIMAVAAFHISTTRPGCTSFVRGNYRQCHQRWYTPPAPNDNSSTRHDAHRMPLDENDSPYDANQPNMDVLRHRMYPIQIATLEQMYQRSLPISTTTTTTRIPTTTSTTKNTSLNSNHPIPFIEFCLHCLLNNDTPYPDSGIRFLLRVSTKAWKEQIYRSVGRMMIPRNVYPYIKEDNNDDDEKEEEAVTAISASISQIQNQFGILVGEGEPYRICFPSEPLEYEITSEQEESYCTSGNHSRQPHLHPNGMLRTTTTTTTWIECQLRHYETNELLVVMGWQLLVTRHTPLSKDHVDILHDSSSSSSTIKEYQIDRVDWQDFREMFRPGLGREEWVRICG